MVQLNGELTRVTSELTDIGHLKTTTTAEVRGEGRRGRGAFDYWGEEKGGGRGVLFL